MIRPSNHNLKYLTRCHYFGKLLDWEYVEGNAMVLKLKTFTATEHFASSNVVRVYVPTELENDIKNELFVGDNYYVIAAPYRTTFKQTYKYRVDMLLNIFKEIV